MGVTKAQERQALKRIRKIVEDVGGAGSYIGMALEGCFEIAEENIENDFACSSPESGQKLNIERTEPGRLAFIRTEVKRIAENRIRQSFFLSGSGLRSKINIPKIETTWQTASAVLFRIEMKEI